MANAAPGWRVQLAALDSEYDAQPAWEGMKAQHPELLNQLRLHVETAELAHGTFHRVQAGPVATRSDAQLLCSQLVQANQDCLVVPK